MNLLDAELTSLKLINNQTKQMEQINTRDNYYSNVSENMRALLESQGYTCVYSGTKYGYINQILNRYIELNTSPNDRNSLNAMNSSSWGLVKAYIMYLNHEDRVRLVQTEPEFIETNPLTNQEIQYIRNRAGVVVYDDVTDNSFVVRNFINLISNNEYVNFMNWMCSF